MSHHLNKRQHKYNEIATLPYNEHEEEIVTMTADAEQNAELAADYWPSYRN